EDHELSGHLPRPRPGHLTHLTAREYLAGLLEAGHVVAERGGESRAPAVVGAALRAADRERGSLRLLVGVHAVDPSGDLTLLRRIRRPAQDARHRVEARPLPEAIDPISRVLLLAIGEIL